MSMACVILAAGQGTRMKSKIPKVLHEICGKTMLQHVVDAVDALRPDKKVIVIGRHGEEIRKAVKGDRFLFVEQKEPKGTADALMSASRYLNNFKGTVLVLNGDMPLVTPQTLNRFLAYSRKNKDSLSIMSFFAEDPSSYGRIVRDRSGTPVRIVEEKDATPVEKDINEVNSGIYAMSHEIMPLLNKIRLNTKKGEYYLTDILEIASGRGLKTGVYCIAKEDELTGINTRYELLNAQWTMKERIVGSLMDKGVSFLDPASVHIHAGVKVGRDTVIYPNVYLEGDTIVGSECRIYPNSRIIDSSIGDYAVIKDSSVIEGSVVKENAQIGPFAHLRPGTKVGKNSKIGNFVEIKKSSVGAGTKASHLSYIGDADVGKNVNIGAGTITCNYDGKEKHKTVIQDGVFIGSDTQIVAPVCIGKGAYVGAGSTITKDVPQMSLAVSRAEQRHIKGWAKKKTKGKTARGKGQEE